MEMVHFFSISVTWIPWAPLGPQIIVFVRFWRLQGPKPLYLQRFGAPRAPNHYICKVLAPQGPQTNVSVMLWRPQGPKPLYL